MSRPSVLLVDADIAHLEPAVAALRAAGFDVDRVVDLWKFRDDMLCVEKYDVVVVNMDLSGFRVSDRGSALVEEIRAHSTLPSVVMVADAPDMYDVREARKYGACDLVSPQDTQNLVLSVRGAAAQKLRFLEASRATV